MASRFKSLYLLVGIITLTCKDHSTIVPFFSISSCETYMFIKNEFKFNVLDNDRADPGSSESIHGRV